MHLLDFYPAQGSTVPGETITLIVEFESSVPETITLQISIQHFSETPMIIEQTVHIASGKQSAQIQWTPPARPAGYAARLEILYPNKPHTLSVTTAFDVLSSWTDFPRYGFLSDFSASREDPEPVLKTLTRFHINGLQFYDWQYRHDQFMAPTENYIDPLGREMSLASVRKLVDAAHRHGMVALPYLAIYAASADFWRAHPSWALYNETGTPIPFGEDFLGLMDPSRGGPWSRHLLAQAAHTLERISFDGLHIDQYGEPKIAWDARHQLVDLPRAFIDFIQSACDRHPNQTILFNAVGNWPIEVLAESAVDFMYIEVWPPDVEYGDLAEIVLNAVRLSHGKSVVIALYLPASHPSNILLADAVILACGGTRIELGEDGRLLADPYFPKHEEISAGLCSQLRQFSDFAVRNGEWLRPYRLSSTEKKHWANGELNPGFISMDDFIWTVIRRYPSLLIVKLINLSGLDAHQRWDEAHASPAPCQNITLKIQMHQRPAQILWDCPEQTNGPLALDFEHFNGTLTFQIPQINFTGLVAIYE